MGRSIQYYKYSIEDFILSKIRIISLVVLFCLTVGTLLFLSVVWIIAVLAGIAISASLDLIIDWVYVDDMIN